MFRIERRKFAYFTPRFIASDVPIILKQQRLITKWSCMTFSNLIARRRLLQILAERPLPLGPAWTIFFPILLSNGSTALKSWSSAPTMNVNVAFWAPVIPKHIEILRKFPDKTHHPRRVHQQNVIVSFEPFLPFLSMFVHRSYCNPQCTFLFSPF